MVFEIFRVLNLLNIFQKIHTLHHW